MEQPSVTLVNCGHCATPVRNAGDWYCHQCGNPVQFRLVGNQVGGQLRAIARLPPPPVFDAARVDQLGHRQDQGLQAAQQPENLGDQNRLLAGMIFPALLPPQQDVAVRNAGATRPAHVVPIQHQGVRRVVQPMAVAPVERVVQPMAAAQDNNAGHPGRRRRRNRNRGPSRQPPQVVANPVQQLNIGRPVVSAPVPASAQGATPEQPRHGCGSGNNQAVLGVVENGARLIFDALAGRGGPRLPSSNSARASLPPQEVEAEDDGQVVDTVDNVGEAVATDQDIRPPQVQEVEDGINEQAAEQVDNVVLEQATEVIEQEAEQAAESVDNVDVAPVMDQNAQAPEAQDENEEE